MGNDFRPIGKEIEVEYDDETGTNRARVVLSGKETYLADTYKIITTYRAELLNGNSTTKILLTHDEFFTRTRIERENVENLLRTRVTNYLLSRGYRLVE